MDICINIEIMIAKLQQKRYSGEKELQKGRNNEEIRMDH